jgi:glycosyltransferase involved in cell wall biosynthesis
MNTPKLIKVPPKISVVLPVYNGGAYLQLSVSSVLKQELDNFELLIVDDQSKDGSYEWLEQLKDERIKLYRNPQNKGLFYNLNFLIAQSSSSLIKLWAQDDIMYPDCLTSFVDFHQQHPAIGFSYSGRDMIDENGTIKENKIIDNTPEIISTEQHARIAYYTGSIAGNIANVCINKKALDRVGLFNEDMKISADFDMWVRLAKHYDTGFIREALIQLRDHNGQLSRNEKYYINHVKEDLQVYRNLDSYVSEETKIAGRKIIMEEKLIFYYTLMVKNFLKGRVPTGIKFFKTISSYTPMWNLTIAFLKKKIFKKK